MSRLLLTIVIGLALVSHTNAGDNITGSDESAEAWQTRPEEQASTAEAAGLYQSSDSAAEQFQVIAEP